MISVLDQVESIVVSVLIKETCIYHSDRPRVFLSGNAERRNSLPYPPGYLVGSVFLGLVTHDGVQDIHMSI